MQVLLHVLLHFRDLFDMQQLINNPPDVYAFVYMLDAEQLCKPCCSMAAGHALAIKQKAQKRSKLRRYLTFDCGVHLVWACAGALLR